MLLQEALQVILVSMTPILELRAGIPLGAIVYGMPIQTVFLLAVLANILAGQIVFLALHLVLDRFIANPKIGGFFKYSVERVRKGSSGLVQKYGLIGIALFIAIPLPGTGAWSGALAAYIFGLKDREFSIANILGVTLAGLIVSAATIGFFSLPI